MRKARATVTKIPDGRNKPWRVTYRESGKRRTIHFARQGEAAAFARAQGAEAHLEDLAITAEERLAWVRIRNAASRCGLSIEATAEVAIAAIETRRTEQITFAAAAKSFLKDGEKRNLRPATLAHYKGMLSRFSDTLPPETWLTEVTREQVVTWILSTYHTEDARYTARTPIMAFFRWAERREWVTKGIWGPALKWQKSKEDKKPVGMYRPAHVYILIKALPPKYRFSVATMFFIGLRPKGEISRIHWEHIDHRRRTVKLPGSVTKTRDGRTLTDLPENFWEWVAWELDRHKQPPSGKILPSNYRNFRSIIRKTLRSISIDFWPRDVTRHCFGSYGFHHQGLESTLEQMGHIAGSALFDKRYKGTSGKWLAKLYFSIRPRQAQDPAKAPRGKSNTRTPAQPKTPA